MSAHRTVGAYRLLHRIGAYRLLHRIGAGGMAEVWLAEPRTPPRHPVAVKLVKGGTDTRRVIARFAAEHRALAVVDHPAIASVLDGGVTGDGTPYIVMEHVDGGPVTEYADAVRASIRARVAWMIEICHGVQHAHHKGILHRDLKPSNILVSTATGWPQPKIIDFGMALARDVDQRGGGAMDTGALVGTPSYMSPEQTGAPGIDVDTRSDVYSLGVVLYELLTGVLPTDSDELGGCDLAELCRRIREVDPVAPSAQIARLGAEAVEIADHRGTHPAALARALRGDLDAIVGKALEKGRGRRYQFPAELAADLGRYLADMPVLARPPSAAHRLGQYVRRNRVGLVTAAGTVAVLAAGIALVVGH